MTVQIDFILAVGLFFTVFIVILGATNSYFSVSLQDAHIQELRSGANFLMSMLATTESNVSLTTVAFKMEIDALSKKNLKTELVSFDMSSYGTIDYNSVMVYDPDTGYNTIPAGSTTKAFLTELKANAMKKFYVYFDDDSSFGAKSVTYQGDDKVNETVWPATTTVMVQYNKIVSFSSRNYDLIKNTFGLDEFHVSLTNMIDFGPAVPDEGDIVSTTMRVLYQKSDGQIASGNLIVYMW